MGYLNLEGLKRFLAKLLVKTANAFDTLEDKVADIERDYLSKVNGGTVEGTLRTDDVQVGKWQNGSPVKDIDPDTGKNRAAGSLRVNGTTELVGDIITHGQDVDFGNVNVSGKLDVGGSASLSETFINGTLNMCGGNIENVQSITASGTVRGNTYKAPKLDATDVSGTRIGKSTEPYADAYITNIHGNLDGYAASADKLNTSAGSTVKPVYFNGGKPAACTYELNATVPSGAKFTDTVYTHPSTSGNKHIPSGGKSGQILRWSADGTAQWGADNNTTYNVATTSQNGLMSSGDKALVNHLGTDAFGIFTVHDTEMWLGYVKDIALENRAGAHFMSNDDSCIYVPRIRNFRVEVGNYTIGDFGSGGLHIDGKVTSTGSDYAKYYEWLDGNLENEDRRGLFVTLDGEKIKTANAEDDFILGVVSAAPGFVENACETEWQGKYLKDIYGERITQEVEVPESTDAKGNTIPATIKTEYVLNPEYNEDEKYIPRSQRPEWTYVGLTGELVVRDDGTCKVNGYCKPSEGGIATEAVTSCGYRVLARLDDTHIKILIK